MPLPDIVICVHGGGVQDVYAANAQLQAVVVDLDTDGLFTSDEGVVAVTLADGAKRLVRVSRPDVVQLGQLSPDHVILKSLEQAGVSDVPS